MIIRALVDGDNLAFACAASAEDADEAWIACSRAHQFMDTILQSTSANEYEIWLSGSHNFRYDVYPEYKANRKDAYRPKWEKEVKQYLTLEWNANWSEGCEADDMLGCRSYEIGSDTILCHLDKDMNQIKGKHFNWAIIRLGKIVREARIYDVSPEEGDRFFWKQVLTGDTTDNIKGVPKIGPVKAEQILLGATTNAEAYERVAEAYGSEEELDKNAQCIYIWRKPNDSWRNLIAP